MRSIGFDGDAAAVKLEDSLGQREPDSGSFRTGIELFEQVEDALRVAGIDPDPIVADEADVVVRVGSNADFDAGIAARAHVFDVVPQQVPHHSHQAYLDAANHGKFGGDVDLDAALGEGARHELERVAHDVAE